MLRRLFIIFIFIEIRCGSIDVEKHLKICRRNSQDSNDCLMQAIRKGLANMVDGIPDLGVPPLDPYHQKELRVEYNNHQVSAKMTMKDIYVEGMQYAIVKKVRLRADEDNFSLQVDMFSPWISVNGSFDGYGRFNSLKVNSTGEFNNTMHNLVYTWQLDGKPEVRNNETYMKIYDFYMRPDVGQMKAFLITHDPKNQEFIQFVNEFANANWRTLYQELLPYAQANWKLIGIRVANKVFLKIPYNTLFPDDSL